MPLFYDRLGREYRSTPPARLIEALRREAHATAWIFPKGESLANEFKFITGSGVATIHYRNGEYTHITCTADIAPLIEEASHAIP